jgi:hypothetical protein
MPGWRRIYGLPCRSFASSVTNVTQASTDVLSPNVRSVRNLNTEAYSQLVVRGSGSIEAREALSSISESEVFLPESRKSKDDARSVLAGLWLLHDWLEESHHLSQSLHSSTGSFWHAILHRREGDFSNSKYWYAKVGGHPVMDVIANQASPLIHQYPADKSLLRVIATGWNPSAFVDFIQSVDSDEKDARRPLAVSLQRLEWSALFEHCARG